MEKELPHHRVLGQKWIFRNGYEEAEGSGIVIKLVAKTKRGANISRIYYANGHYFDKLVALVRKNKNIQRAYLYEIFKGELVREAGF